MRNLNNVLIERSRRWKPNLKAIGVEPQFLECRIFEPIKIEGTIYSLSIQASPYHMCDKTDKIYDAKDYETFELAFIMTYGDDYLVKLDDMPLLKDYPRINDLYKYYDNKTLIGNVPRDLVEDIYNYLIK